MTAARATFYIALYFMGEGLLMLLLPNLLLGVLGLPPTQEPWLRLLGLTFCVLASYYLAMVKHDVRPFYQVTAYGRMLQFPLVLGLIAIGWVPPVVAAVQLVEFLSGLYVHRLLRKEAA